MSRFQRNQMGRRKQLLVSDTLLFWYSSFKYRFIKLNLVRVEKLYFVDVNPVVRTQRVRTNKACVMRRTYAY